MIAYQRKLLADMSDIGEPGELPAEIAGLAPETLADLSAAMPEAAAELGYAGHGFFAVELPDPPPPIPSEVPMYKVKKYMALVKAQTGGATDLHAQVMAYIDALPEPNRTMARIDFGPDPEQIGSPNLVVNSPLALGAKAALGLSDEEYASLVMAADALA